jgi:hypothetical protein
MKNDAPPAPRELGPTLFIALSSAAFLYWNLWLSPRIPILEGGDQVFFWMDAQRMLLGEHVYRDFFQFTPPGTDFFYLAVFKIFGPRIWVTNAIILLLGVALALACYFVARRLMNRAPAALSAFLFLTLLYGKLLNATHHWFSVLAILVAVAVVLGGRSITRMICAGAVLGVATFFTQTHAVVAALIIVLWLLREEYGREASWRRAVVAPAVVLASLAIVTLALNAPLLSEIGLRQLWQFQVSYVRHYMVGGLSQFPGLPETVSLRRLPVVAQYIFVCEILPFVYPLALVLLRFRPATRDQAGNHTPLGARRSASGTPSGILLLALLGLALFLEVATSANWLRLYVIAIPGVILLVWLADAAGRARRAILALICAAIAILAARDAWTRHHQPYLVAQLPAGQAALDPLSASKFAAISQRLHPGEFFFQATWPGAYLPLGLRNPVYLDALRNNDETRPECVTRSVADLESKQVRYVLWSPRLDEVDPRAPQSNHLAPLRDDLRVHFQIIQTFADGDQLWQRRP